MLINDSTPDELLFPPDRARGLRLPESRPACAYAGVAEPFPPALLIPRSEWRDRIAERKRLRATITALCDQAGLPVKDQRQTNYCVTEDTEVLTERGWTPWPRYNGTDLLGTMNTKTGFLEFQAPLAVHAYEHDGPMIYSTNQSVDFGVTPDHRMLVRKWDERRRTLADEFTFQRAGDLGWYFGLPHAPTGFLGTELVTVGVEGDRAYAGDDFIALVSRVVSDGYAGGTENTRNWVSFACFVEERLPAARALASRLGFTEKESTPGVFIRYDAGALAAWFRANAYVSPELGAHNKCVPRLVMQASGRQIGHFLATYGDQAHARSNDYFSTSRRVVDDIQELLLRVGQRGTVWTGDQGGKVACLKSGKQIVSRRPMHHVYVRGSSRLSINRKLHLETESYRGPVYCATVPNSTLVTRRNGTVLVSGNCWANAPTHCVEILRVLQGQKPLVLSAASVAAQIKAYQNVGGWGREALEWISDHGAVPADRWPNDAIDPRYATPANLRLALDYRAGAWMALEDRNLDQLISCVLRNIPVGVGYTWWGHEVTATDADWVDGDVALIVDNSWGQEWGTNGRGMIQGSRMLPDDAVAPFTAVAS